MNFKKFLKDRVFFISASLLSVFGFWWVCSRSSAGQPAQDLMSSPHDCEHVSPQDLFDLIQEGEKGKEHLEYAMGFYEGAMQRQKLGEELTGYFSRLKHEVNLEAAFSGFQSGFKSQKTTKDLAPLEAWLRGRRDDLHQEADKIFASEWQTSVLAEEGWELGHPGCFAYRCSSETLREAMQEQLKGLTGSEASASDPIQLPEGGHRFLVSIAEQPLALQSSTWESKRVIQLLTSRICFLNTGEQEALKKEEVSRALEGWLAILIKSPEKFVEIKLRHPFSNLSFTFSLKHQQDTEPETSEPNLKGSEAPVVDAKSMEVKASLEAHSEDKPQASPARLGSGAEVSPGSELEISSPSRPPLEAGPQEGGAEAQ